MKDSHLAIIAVILILVFTGTITLPKIDLGNWLGGNGTTGSLMDVDRKIDFSVTDKYAGSTVGSVSNGLTIYDSDGATQLEQLSIAADGTINTAYSYPSGKVLWVKYVNSNSKQWFRIVVPQMSEADVDSQTYNVVELQTFTVCSVTDALKDQAGNSIADAGNYNFTATGTTAIFTYSFTVSTDNTGFMASDDPLYDINWDAVVYMKLSTGNYETLVNYDWDNEYTLGTAVWCAEVIPPTGITKYKVANEYVHKGLYDFVYTMDGSNLSGDTTVMQLYLKIYSDIDYHRNHGGNFGPDVVELAETTVTLYE